MASNTKHDNGKVSHRRTSKSYWTVKKDRAKGPRALVRSHSQPHSSTNGFPMEASKQLLSQGFGAPDKDRVNGNMSPRMRVLKQRYGDLENATKYEVHYRRSTDENWIGKRRPSKRSLSREDSLCVPEEDSVSNSKGYTDRSAWFIMIRTYQVQEAFIRPFPGNKEVVMDINEHYAPIMLIPQMDQENVTKISPNQLFDSSNKGTDRVTRVLVTGNEGAGKSFLCQKIAFEWAHEVTTIAALDCSSTVTVIYRLENLGSEANFEKELLHYLRSMYCPSRNDEEFTERVVSSLRWNLLFILDGYDKQDRRGQQRLRQFLDSKDSLFSRASFLVTSRPTKDPGFIKLFQKHLFISEDSEKRAKEVASEFLLRHTPIGNQGISGLGTDVESAMQDEDDVSSSSSRDSFISD